MSSLAELQSSFMAFLLDGETGISAVLREGSETGLAIYANAYTVRLAEALRTDHERLAEYLGKERFGELAREYVKAHPSRQRSLRHFGDGWPTFLDQRVSQGVAEIAQFERLLLDVFDAADETPLTLSDLQQLPAASWPGLRLRFHPSLRLFEPRHNAVSIWQAAKMKQAPPQIEVSQDERWLLWRNRERVSEFRIIDQDEYRALTLFREAQPLAEICDRLSRVRAPADIVTNVNRNLQRWLTDGIVVGIDATP